MMKVIASDDVWQQVTWRGTASKTSFVGGLKTIKDLIVDISCDTFKGESQKFFEEKLKSFLRHTEERISRKNKCVREM